MPLPPPPALAFMITGYPISSTIFIASFSVDISPSYPGTTGMFKDFANSLAFILSPITVITSGFGPINLKPLSIHFSAKEAFSARKPKPG